MYNSLFPVFWTNLYQQGKFVGHPAVAAFFYQSIGINPRDWENFNRRAVLPREHVRFVSGTRARDDI